MPDPLGTIFGIPIGGAAVWVWTNREQIKAQLSAVRDYFHTPNDRPILIIGSGGCGKTTLLRILAGERDWLLDQPWAYRESTVIEKRTLEDDPSVQIVATPGQPHRARTDWPTLQADLAAGRYRGIILMTAYGYHSLGEGMRPKDLPQYQAGVSRPMTAFCDRYTKERRQDEIRVLQQLATPLQPCGKPVWLFTVTAKADLWHEEAEEVRRHYTTGDYGQALDDLRDKLDPKLFRHDLALASLVIANFATVSGEIIKASTAGYDHQKQVESVQKLIAMVGGLKDWEAGR